MPPSPESEPKEKVADQEQPEKSHLKFGDGFGGLLHGLGSQCPMFGFAFQGRFRSTGGSVGHPGPQQVRMKQSPTGTFRVDRLQSGFCGRDVPRSGGSIERERERIFHKFSFSLSERLYLKNDLSI